MSEIIPARIVRIPIEVISKPRRGYVDGILENWWIVDPKTDSVIFYKRHNPKYCSPQCNGNESITRNAILPIWVKFGFEVRLVPVAFVPLWMTGDVDLGYNLVPLLKEEAGGGPKVK